MFRNSFRRLASDPKQTFKWETLKGQDLYDTVVSYVITLFNEVDMLFSKLQKTDIKINIAGIVIGNVSILN